VEKNEAEAEDLLQSRRRRRSHQQMPAAKVVFYEGQP
jgi:hypothetical protein